MSTYIKDMVETLAEGLDNKEKMVVRIETATGNREAMLLMVVDVEDDYIIAHGQKSKEVRNFSIAHMANWYIVPYVEKEWSRTL